MELEQFVTTMKKNDIVHKEVLVRMADSLSQAKAAYERMIKERDLHKSGEADTKAQLEAAQRERELETSRFRLEVDSLKKKVEELEVTKAVAAVNNAMSAIGINTWVHRGYFML